MATIPEYRSLTPAALDALERAVRERLRVALRRRGTEYVVVAERLETSGRDDVLAGRLPLTGELLTFPARDPGSFAGVPREIGRAHVLTSVTSLFPMPSFLLKKKNKKHN